MSFALFSEHARALVAATMAGHAMLRCNVSYHLALTSILCDVTRTIRVVIHAYRDSQRAIFVFQPITLARLCSLSIDPMRYLLTCFASLQIERWVYLCGYHFKRLLVPSRPCTKVHTQFLHFRCPEHRLDNRSSTLCPLSLSYRLSFALIFLSAYFLSFSIHP